jgi:hypothetical protein
VPSGPPVSDADERLRFIATPEALAELELTVEDLADPDLLSLVVEQQHPEFEQALEEDLDEIEVHGEWINPRLHLAMHEIVATQLWNDDPPEVWETATRLLQDGYDRHEILHMLASPVVGQVWGALHDELPYDRDLHLAALQALPGSWEKRRTARTAERRHTDGRKAARRAAKASRRRNRRPS